MPRTIVVMDDDGMGKTHRHRVVPKRLLWAWGGSLLGIGLVTALLLVFTPLRTLIPGYGTQALQQSARLNAIRVSALQDSVALQRRYIQRLQQLMTGRVDSVAGAGATGVSGQPASAAPATSEGEAAASSEPDGPHAQPAFSVSGGVGETRSLSVPDSSEGLPALQPPVRPPVESGFPTRSFDARDSHYGIDVAVSKGTLVRTVGPGYVVLSDWTQEGGYTIAVQHASGYLSVYKHNQRLLKQTGDRVQAREAVAVSGNTGEMTTGPHVHFELWQNGLAQNPRSYVTGW